MTNEEVIQPKEPSEQKMCISDDTKVVVSLKGTWHNIIRALLQNVSVYCSVIEKEYKYCI